VRPEDWRIGRLLIQGRYQAIKWVGGCEWTGVVDVVDDQQDRIRITTASDVSVPLDQIRPWLEPDIEGLAPVVYLGPGQSDDGWGEAGLMIAERIPFGHSLVMRGPWCTEAVARFGVTLVNLIRKIHARGFVIATLRPEGIIVGGGSVSLIVRGDRLWLMPRQNASKAGSISPWPPGYLAPELLFNSPVTKDVSSSADVFSLGVILAELMLGQPPYPRDSLTSLLLAQREGQHAPLPKSGLGDAIGRSIQWDPFARPTIEELLGALEAERTDKDVEQSGERTIDLGGAYETVELRNGIPVQYRDWHDYEPTPEELKEIVARIEAATGYGILIAGQWELTGGDPRYCQRSVDLLALFPHA
jgi:hypothetical protein